MAIHLTQAGPDGFAHAGTITYTGYAHGTVARCTADTGGVYFCNVAAGVSPIVASVLGDLPDASFVDPNTPPPAGVATLRELAPDFLTLRVSVETAASIVGNTGCLAGPTPACTPNYPEPTMLDASQSFTVDHRNVATTTFNAQSGSWWIAPLTPIDYPDGSTGASLDLLDHLWRFEDVVDGMVRLGLQGHAFSYAGAGSIAWEAWFDTTPPPPPDTPVATIVTGPITRGVRRRFPNRH